MGEGVDLAIRIGHLPDSGLVATRIGRTGYVLCGSPAYLAAAGTPAHPDDLHGHTVELPPVPISAVHLPTRHPSPAGRALVAKLWHHSGGRS